MKVSITASHCLPFQERIVRAVYTTLPSSERITHMGILYLHEREQDVTTHKALEATSILSSVLSYPFLYLKDSIEECVTDTLTIQEKREKEKFCGVCTCVPGLRRPE